MFAEDILSDSPDIDEASNEEILSTYNTVRLDSVADDIFDDIQVSMQDSEKKLLPLKAWVDKKQSSPPYSWLKRWVTVVDGHLLWSDRQISVQGKLTKEERKRWNKCLNLKSVSDVTKMETKRRRRFRLSLKGDRDYIWRAKTAKARDEWVAGLRGHINYAQMSSVYSTSNVLDLP